VVTLTVVSGRGGVSIVQQPSSADGHTFRVEINDPQDGASFYEFVLTYAQ
jgi:hypothetical protein